MDLSPPFQRLTGMRLDPLCVEISPDGRWLALAEWDPVEVCVFDVRGGVVRFAALGAGRMVLD